MPITLNSASGSVTLSPQNVAGATTVTVPSVNGTLSVQSATAFTAGSVVFAGTSGVYSQSNADFFWDNTNSRLGIGTASPAYKIDILGQSRVAVNGGSAQLRLERTGTSTGAGYIGADSASTFGVYDTSFNQQFVVSQIGNVGIGVTPSAWGSNFKSFEMGNAGYGITSAISSGIVYTFQNTFNNGTNWVYKTNGAASRFDVSSNGFIWNLASSGTANAAITFTQAMTLDASGNLGIGTASPAFKLDVVSTGDMAGRFSTTGTANAASFYLSSGNGTTSGKYAYARFLNNDTNNQEWRLGTYGTDSFALYNAKASSYALTVDTSGNLLVGTTSSPGTNLLSIANSSTTGYGISVSCNSSNTTYRYFEGYSTSASAQKIAIYTDGNVRIAVGSTYANFSDAKLKTNIVDATSKLDDVCALKVRNFSSIEDPNSKYIGFIAQEVEEVFPSLVFSQEDTE